MIISRYAGQTIRIGPDIWVKVTDIGRGQVKLGISAPKDVSIDRTEVVAKQEGEYLDIPDFLRRGKD